MAKETGSSRTDTIVKVMLVFFISLLSFSVGTFVGKQVSDSDHRRLALESEMKDGRDVASDDKDDSDHAGKITEKDVDHLADEFVNKEKNEGEAPTADAAKTDVKEGADGYKPYAHAAKDESAEKSKSPTESKMESPADKVASGQPPGDAQAETRKPSSALPGVATSSIGKFTIQVASFATEVEAKGQASDLKAKGWNAFYIPAEIGGRTWYRVSVGLFNNHTSAQSFRHDFMKESGNKNAIVTKIVQ